jgi:hypothetical protein
MHNLKTQREASELAPQYCYSHVAETAAQCSETAVLQRHAAAEHKSELWAHRSLHLTANTK